MIHRLFTAVSALSLIVFVVTVGLWMRSFRIEDAHAWYDARDGSVGSRILDDARVVVARGGILAHRPHPGGTLSEGPHGTDYA
jgi:hypothetical protein